MTVSLVLLAVILVHFGHARHATGPGKAWHTAHIAMALGMIAVLLPGGASSGQLFGLVVFTVAAVSVSGLVIARLLSGADVPAMWLVVAVNLGAVAYLYTLPTPNLTWLTVAAIALFFAQAMAWGTGHLTILANRANVTIHSRKTTFPLTPIVMSITMAYLLTATQFA